MVSYLQCIKDTESKFCSPEVFDQLTNSPMVKQLIEDYRKGNKPAKSLLPTFMFQGYDPKVLEGKTGSRLAKDLRSTGLFIMDFDHIEDALALYRQFEQEFAELIAGDNLALAHITPSGKGLRLVIQLPEGMSIEDAQRIVAEKLEVKMDSVVKDLSRQSFCPQASDILYINKELLFNLPDNNDTNRENGIAAGNNGDGDAARLLEGADNSDRSAGEGNVLRTADAFNTHFRGIPYTRIVEQLIEVLGGTPEEGNRELTLFRLASDMAKITGRSAPWLESILPTFGLPEAEWRATIAGVCKKPIETGYSRTLQEALDRCKREIVREQDDNDEQDKDALPPEMPKDLPPLIAHLVSNVPDHLKPAVCMMCFPALAAHVANSSFYLSTGEDEELGLCACLLAKQSIGKSCIKKPIEAIMADIDRMDKMYNERLRQWKEHQQTRKSNEKGEAKPRVPILWLPEDTTSAAFIECLGAAEDADPDRPRQCCYTNCSEIEKLYAFSSKGGKSEVRQTIKLSFDRDRTGSKRSTAEAVNENTRMRWNWTASSTIENGKDFFTKRMITDGTVSRVDFCTIIPPQTREKYKVTPYTKEWRDGLAPYLKNLNDYRCQNDEDGEIIPATIEPAIALDDYFDDLIKERNEDMPDDVYEDYGRRCRVSTIKKMIVLYIAHGQQWLPEFDAFARWMFDYSMWCKLAFFYDRAANGFTTEHVSFKGQWTPLKFMHKTFTFSDFAAVCHQHADRVKNPRDLLYAYKSRKVIVQQDDKYIISDAYCEKHHIPD